MDLFIALGAIYKFIRVVFVFFEKIKMKKFLSIILTTLIILTNTLAFNVGVANAGWEWPKIELPAFEWPHIELPHIEIPSFTIPGTNFTIDPKLGLDAFKDIANQIPDKIDVPGTSFSIYPKESVGTNVVKNLIPFAGDLVNYLNPLKPAASAAKLLLGWARPFIEPLIKQVLPSPVKGAFFGVKTQINNIIKSVDIPLVKDILLPIWDLFVGPIDDLAMELVDILAEEETNSGSGPGQHQITGNPPQMILSSPFVNEKPIGYFDNINADGIATGWAFDPNSPSESIKIRLNPINGGDIIINADLPRVDLNKPGNHGFSFRIPSSMRDGIRHNLDAFAIDIDDNAVQVKLNNQQSYYLFEEAFGALNTIEKNGNIIGWAIDPDRINDSAEVKFYIDGSTYIGSTIANQAYTYMTLPEGIFTKAPNASRNIGFIFNIDPNKYRDGKEHFINAFVVNKDDLGQTKEILISAYPFYFMYPEILNVNFTEDPITIQQGSRIFQTINGIANKNHNVSIYIDDKLFDVNNDKHGYPFYKYDKWLNFVQSDVSDKTRSADFNFKLPEDIAVGEHTVTIDGNVNEYLGFVYKASFKINVVPYEPMIVTVPYIIKPESEFDVLISKIPLLVKFTGKDANATIKSLFLSSENGSYMAKPMSIKENGDGTATVHVSITYELARIRKDRGEINASLWVKFENDLAKEEFRIAQMMIDQYFDAKTQKVENPILEPLCKSTNNPIFNLKGGIGTIEGSGANFGCFGDFTVTVSGVNKGKDFSFVLDKNYWYGNYAVTIPPMAYSPKQLEWNGNLTNFAIYTTEIWTQNYPSVEEVTITIKDSAGNTASAKVNIISPYQVRVLPLENNELIPGEYFRLAYKGFKYGNQVNLSIDSESTRQFYIRGGNKGSDDGFAYYDELYLPTWLAPGKHNLLMQDMTLLDAKGKPLYKAETSFVIGDEDLEDLNEINEDQNNNEKEENKREPTVSVNPLSVKVGDTIDINIAGFGALGSVTIYLRPASTPDFGGTKLSGYADYTDSSGSLVKNDIKIPDNLSAGKYIIVVTDTQNLKATADLTIEEIYIPKKAIQIDTKQETETEEVLPELDTEESQQQTEPVIEDTTEPQDDQSSQNEYEEQTNPTCTNGFTYSPTFKMCIENEPEQSSPYEGLPCSESIPMYSQKGCIP